MKRSDIEIMAPAGSYEALAAALAAGADSVYFGVGTLNMRARSAANFTDDDLERIVGRIHEAGAKGYLTLNTIIYDDEAGLLDRTVDRAREAGVDAVIASDIAAIRRAREAGLEVHVSTQCNISNTEAVRFYARWADTMVLARELTLGQVERIARAIDGEPILGPRGERVKIEMFAHGALCMAVSGRCYLSLHETGHSANRGDCRQICRRGYTLTDRETGAQIDAEGPYLLSPKDLCTIDFLDRFLAAGVRVLKIEGRARGAEYVKRTVECYDRALRAIGAGSYTPEYAAALREELATVFNRGFWEGYYAGDPTVELSARYGSAATRRKVYVGKVVNYYARLSVAEVLVEASPLAEGDEILFTGPTTGVAEQRAEGLRAGDPAQPAERVAQGEVCALRTTGVVRRGDRLYRMEAAG